MNCGPLWKSRSVNVTIAAKLGYNKKDATLHQENVKDISSAARSFSLNIVFLCLSNLSVVFLQSVSRNALREHNQVQLNSALSEFYN